MSVRLVSVALVILLIYAITQGLSDILGIDLLSYFFFCPPRWLMVVFSLGITLIAFALLFYVGIVSLKPLWITDRLLPMLVVWKKNKNQDYAHSNFPPVVAQG